MLGSESRNCLDASVSIIDIGSGIVSRMPDTQEVMSKVLL